MALDKLELPDIYREASDQPILGCFDEYRIGIG